AAGLLLPPPPGLGRGLQPLSGAAHGCGVLRRATAHRSANARHPERSEGSAFTVTSRSFAALRTTVDCHACGTEAVRGCPASALLVLPVPPLALGHPLDGLRQPLCAGLLAFCLDDPFDVFAPAARREGIERRLRRPVLLQRDGEVLRHIRRRLRRGLARRRLHPALVEL